jgi:putative ABC transport system ATP-binding protein
MLDTAAAIASPVAALSPLVSLSGVRLELASQAGMVNILKGVDLEIGRGRSVGIVGPSGSGKSTLLMVIGGLERVTAGSVNISGADIVAMNEDALARFRRAHVGIVFQAFHLVPTMTALENVALPLELAGARDAMQRAAELLDAVGLGQRHHHYPGQLSGGEQQRVAVARAFVAAPDLVLADEPTGNLDGATGRLVMDLVFELCRKRGTTLLLVTHDDALAARCEETVRIADGRIVAHERA